MWWTYAFVIKILITLVYFYICLCPKEEFRRKQLLKFF